MLDPELFDSADALNLANRRDDAAADPREHRSGCIFRSFWANLPSRRICPRRRRRSPREIGIVTQSYYPRYGGVTEHVHATATERCGAVTTSE